MRPAAFVVALCLPLHAAVVGTSNPAPSLTEARILTLPAGQRGPWLDYLRRSAAQEKADRAAMAHERESMAHERQGMAGLPPLPKQGFSGRAMPLHREPAFYKSDEARRVGDIILSFQTPAGGWSKNLDMSEPRGKGQSYAAANAPPTPAPAGDFDKPRDEQWHYVGTLDNDATNTELHFLALLSEALPGHEGDRFRASFLRGVQYLLDAQFPNGGWPQVWPLDGGYHDAITFNDNAVTESAEMLGNVARHTHVTTAPSPVELASARSSLPPQTGIEATPRTAVEDYSFVPAALSQRAGKAVSKALECILATQIRVPSRDSKGSTLAVWGQQHDPLTLAPVSARNYEPAALSSGESADILKYLMSLPHPSPAVVRAIDAAAAWFTAHQIVGYIFTGGRNTPGGRKLTPQQDAPPLWARFYSLDTGKPIFGDRDKTIHDDVMDLSLERRNGYAWYSTGPNAVLAQYRNIWKPGHAAS